MAQRLQPLVDARTRQAFAVGAGTAAALRRAGIADVSTPARMDSEGLLALPGLQELDGTTLGLVTAPGGRGEITPALQQRGARVLRADVYERVAIAPSPRALAALRALDAPAWLALSSAAFAQSYPTRPVTFIVPYGAGGPVDTMARTLSEAMRASIGRPSTEMVSVSPIFRRKASAASRSSEIKGGPR